MPPKKSGRPARPAPARRSKRPGTGGRPSRSGTPGRAAARSGRPVPARDRSRRVGARPTRREPAGEVVLGTVPVASRLVGAAGVVGGLLLGVAVVLPYLDVGPVQVDLGDSLVTLLVAWIWPLVVVVAGVSVAAGRYPRLGLAALGVAGTLSVAGLVGELYWASEAGARGRFEIIAGRRLLTSTVEPLAGWYVGVAGLAMLVLVGVAAGWLWSRVVMDDSGKLDPGRPLLGGLAAVSGVVAVLSLIVGPVAIPDQVTVSQQLIGGQVRQVESVVPIEGAIGLFGRPGLGLAGGLLLSAVLVFFSMFATTLRPRLAVVGALAAFTGYVTAIATRALVEAGRSEELVVSVGGWGLVVAAIAYLGLTALSRNWEPPERPAARGLPMRPASRRALKQR